MIFWRGGKAGFVGGIKYAIRGFFQSQFSATSETPSPDIDITWYGIEKTSSFSGIEKLASFSGIEKVAEYTGQEKQSSFSGIEKTSVFSGVKQ